MKTAVAQSALTANASKSSKLKELKQLSDKQFEDQKALMSAVSYKLVDIDEIRYYADVRKAFEYIFFLHESLVY